MTEEIAATGTPDPGAPVALVVQRRIADAGYARYAHWLGKVAERLASWPGFEGQEVIPPTPPAQVDWVAVQRFANAAAARAWLQSGECAALVAEVRDLFVGQEDVHLLTDAGPRREATASLVISFNVAPEHETDFLAWQREIQAVEADVKGFLRHKIERPVPGVHDEWIIILSFDSDANLTAWLDSPLRKRLIDKGARFNADINLRRTSYGFDFWFQGQDGRRPSKAATFKNNLLVLLVLYPVVYLWGFFVSTPLLTDKGMPFWLALFIGNLVSTQLLGWWAVPAAFRAFGWWLAPEPGLKRDILGYAVVAALYALSMAGFAALLAWNWGG